MASMKHEITERVIDALAHSHMQQKELAQAIDVPISTLNSWIKRGGDFPASYAGPIAKALKVSVIWLLTGDDVERPVIPDSYVELNENEAFLIETYRSLDKAGQIVVSNSAVEEMRRVKAEQGITA